jgi:hypothetical protein
MVAQNATIYKEDYNTIQTQISDLLGTGSGDSGYGQSVTSIPVATGTLISAQSAANQWISLYNDMKKVADHQGTNIGTLTTAYTANVKTGSLIQASDINKFSDTIATLVANKLVAGDLALATTAGVDGSRTATWGGQVGPAIVRHIFTVTFTDNNALRAYFNSGGSIKFAANIASGVDQNTDWNNLLSSMGTITYSQLGSRSSGNTGTTSNIRPYDLSTQQTVYSKGGGGSFSQYAANFYQIRASRNNNVLTFEVVFEDDHTSVWYDQVTGTLTSTITYQKSNGTYITIPTPAFSLSRNLSSDAG